jgi:hypothetical protein
LNELRPNGQLLAVYEAQLVQLYRELGHALHAAAFLRNSNLAHDDLASP